MEKIKLKNVLIVKDKGAEMVSSYSLFGAMSYITSYDLVLLLDGYNSVTVVKDRLGYLDGDSKLYHSFKVLDKNDLTEFGEKQVELGILEYQYFKCTWEVFSKHDLVIFLHDDDTITVLKDRYDCVHRKGFRNYIGK